MFGIPGHASDASVATNKLGMELSEGSLIRRTVEGQADAFCELVLPYQRAIFVAAYAVLQNEADAEDVTQDAVLSAFTKLSKFRGESKFATWFYRIGINASLMKLRSNRRHPQTSLDEPSRNDIGDTVLLPRELADWATPADELQKKELRRTVLQAVASLHPKYRAVLILRDLRQFTIAQTAKRLGVSKVAVKTRLFRARLQMRNALESSWSVGGNQGTRRQTNRRVGPGQSARGSRRNSTAAS